MTLLATLRKAIELIVITPGSTTGTGILNKDYRSPTTRIPIGISIEISEIVAAVQYFISNQATAVTEQFNRNK